jgi:hypothetical protein
MRASGSAKVIAARSSILATPQPMIAGHNGTKVPEAIVDPGT